MSVGCSRLKHRLLPAFLHLFAQVFPYVLGCQGGLRWRGCLQRWEGLGVVWSLHRASAPRSCLWCSGGSCETGSPHALGMSCLWCYGRPCCTSDIAACSRRRQPLCVVWIWGILGCERPPDV